MSKPFRKNWPILKNLDSEQEKPNYEFTYKPDNTKLLNNAKNELEER